MRNASAGAEQFRRVGFLEGAQGRLVRFFGPQFVPVAFSWIVLGLILALVLFVLYMTFVPGLPTVPGWTLDHWKSIGRAYIVTKVIPNTLIVGVGTVLVGTGFATPLAWLLHRTAFPLRNLFMALIASVVVVPGFVKAMGWIMLLNPRIGLVNKAIAAVLGLERVPFGVDNPWGMAWVMGLMLTPTMFFLISGPMQTLDPVLEEAAEVAGAGRWRTMMHVSLPLVWPAVLAGSIYIFMTSISIFEVPAMLGGAGGQSPVLATELFYSVHPPTQDSAELKYGAAGVYGVLIAGPSIIALYFYYRVLAKARRFQVITGRGYRPKLYALGGYKYAAVGFVCFYLALAVVLPMLVLLWASLLPYLQMPSVAALSKVSLENYHDFLPSIGGVRVIRNTVMLVSSVTALVLFFSFMVSWVVVRTQLPGRRIMDAIVMLPHAIPGLAFAFALFMVALLLSIWVPWISLTGTVAIIVVAHLLNRLAYGTRITNAALLQVHQELEESARICGAKNAATWWWIMMPLIKPSLVYAGLWTALLTFREVTMALFLTGPKNVVFSVGTWILWRQGDLTTAAASAVVMVGVMVVLLLATLSVVGTRMMHYRDLSPARRGG